MPEFLQGAVRFIIDYLLPNPPNHFPHAAVEQILDSIVTPSLDHFSNHGPPGAVFLMSLEYGVYLLGAPLEQ